VLKRQYVREPSPALLDTLAKRIGYGGKKGSAARRKMLRAAPHELARRFPSTGDLIASMQPEAAS
jgi:hypothetical protein